MSSWKYIYFFPPSETRLQPAKGVDVLLKYHFEPSEKIIVLVPVDDDGHMGEFGEEVRLTEWFAQDVRQRLENGDQFFIEWTLEDKEVNVIFTLACTFSVEGPNPHICFGWPRNMFHKLSNETKESCEEMIKVFAKSCGAVFVIIGNDLLDNFEDRFLEIDGKRLLDTEVSHQYGHGIEAVWVDKVAVDGPPEGINNPSPIDIGNGFLSYVIKTNDV